MVFQSYALFPHLTVEENIAFGLEVRDVPKRDARERARAAAELVGCADQLNRRPGTLSGGERQRVALARALVREPDVFLLDEPLSNLDAELRSQMRLELKALHARVGGTMVHVTHDQAEALVLGDRVAVLRAGVIEQVGAPDELWHEPANAFVAGFVGAPGMNIVSSDGPLHVEGLPKKGLLLGVRPEAVRLAANGVPASVAVVEVVGADAFVHVELGGERLVVRVAADSRPAPGAAVGIAVDRVDVYLFDPVTGGRVAWT
jgi:multiple sugar transport system ATP-binding protein